MPRKKSAMKRLRQDKIRYVRNKAKVTEIKSLAKKVLGLISAKNKEEAAKALTLLESRMFKAVKTDTLKKKAASRRISRLRKHVNKI